APLIGLHLTEPCWLSLTRMCRRKPRPPRVSRGMEIAAMPTNSRTYMIVLDAATIGAEYGPIVRFITSAPMFRGWWNHLPYTFLVSSDLDADAISEGLRPYTKEARFLVIEVNP